MFKLYQAKNITLSISKLFVFLYSVIISSSLLLSFKMYSFMYLSSISLSILSIKVIVSSSMLLYLSINYFSSSKNNLFIISDLLFIIVISTFQFISNYLSILRGFGVVLSRFVILLFIFII